MNINVTFDWKFVVALGVAPSCIILASKLDMGAAERVLSNACKVCAPALQGEC